MKKFEKISDLNKGISEVEQMTSFQIRLVEMKTQILKRTKIIDNRVKRHEAKLKRLAGNVSFIESMGEKNPANFRQAFEQFKSDIYGLNGSHLANIHNDTLEKDLLKCSTSTEEKIVEQYYEVKSKDTLKRVELLRKFYVSQGFQFRKLRKKTAEQVTAEVVS